MWRKPLQVNHRHSPDQAIVFSSNFKLAPYMENTKTPHKTETTKFCLSGHFSHFVKLWEFLTTYFLAIGVILMLIIGSQWPSSGTFLKKIYFPFITITLCFLLCGLRTKTDELKIAFKSYKAIVWGILTILLAVPITGTQITKTIQFATRMDDNMTTSESTVMGNVTAIGPTEFAFALQVFFVVPASMSAGAVLCLVAGGNFSLALVLMLITNSVSVFTASAMLVWLTDLSSGVSIARLGEITLMFLLTCVLPTVTGKLLRLVCVVAENVDLHERGVNFAIISLYVLSTWYEVSRLKVEEDLNNVVSMNILIIVGYSSIMHIMFLVLNWIASGFLELTLPVKKTIVLLGSHKALSFALKILEFLTTDVGSRRLMSVVCVIAYLTLLVLDSTIVCKWSTIREDEEKVDKKTDQTGKYGTVSQEDD